MTEKPKKNPWCVVPECTRHFSLEGRHFFKFPKEHDRWLQWVRACGRTDLEPKGPLYAHQNCRLCNLHFEEKWLKLNKVRARLHADAIPTRFFGPPFGRIRVVNGKVEMDDEKKDESTNLDNEETTETSFKQEKEGATEDTSITEIDTIESPSEQDNTRVLQFSEDLSSKTVNSKTYVAPSTSNTSTVLVALGTPSKNGVQKKKLCFKIVKLKPVQGEALLETIRQIQEANKRT